MFIPNARVSLLRGEASETEYGSPVLSMVPIRTGLDASIVESSRETTSPETGRSYVVNRVQGLLPRGTDVRENDRLQDEDTGYVYEVQAASPPPARGPMTGFPVQLELRRVEA